MTWGQALHLGGNKPSTLALMCSYRSSQEKKAQLSHLGCKASERIGRQNFQSLQASWGIRDNSPHMDRRSGNSGALTGFPQVAGRFSIAQLPTQTRVFFPNPSSPLTKFPHSFGYFKLVLRLRSFTSALNLTVFPSVAVKDHLSTVASYI